MPVIWIFLILLVWLVVWICDKSQKPARPFTSQEMDSMMREMCGKSQKECRQIFKRYKNFK